MDRKTEIDLLKQVVGLKEARSFHLDESETFSAVSGYLSPDRFAREMAMFRAMPLLVAHVSELAAPDAFLRREIAGIPMLLTGDGAGSYRAFLNVCRHRGTRLVDAASGCARRFTCPYHAWTWNNRGELVGLPHGREGFPALDRADYGLKELHCVERHGWIWVSRPGTANQDPTDFLAGLGADIEWIGSRELKVRAESVETRDVNWKILVEGGLEAYHFKVAHRDTIGPYFNDNLSTYQVFGSHLRSVLPRASIRELADLPEEEWSIRQHANLLYTIFPLNQFLVQQDHLVWVQLEPLTESRSRLVLRTLAPEGAGSEAHWQRNHRITCTTLAEDFEIGESIQAGLASGANDNLTFGRFEGALRRFNDTVERLLGGQDGAAA